MIYVPSLELRNGPEEPVYPAHRLQNALLLEVSIYLGHRSHVGVTHQGRLRATPLPPSSIEAVCLRG